MKKVLVSLLVLALAMTSAFAAVDITGEVVAGYTFQYNNDEWYYHAMGQDGIDTAPIKIDVKVADENGYWDVTMKGALIADNRLGGNLNVDLGKIILGADSDLSLKLGMYANNRITGYRAYTNQSGLNLDRVRTQEKGLWANLDVAYGDLVAVQIGGGPKLQPGDGANNVSADPTNPTQNITDDKWGTNWIGDANYDFIVSAIVRPINGLAVSAAYTLVGDCGIVEYTSPNGYMNVAASVDLGAILGTDWTLGIDVADKMAFKKADTDPFVNLFLASVYGGVDAFQLAVEYGVATASVEGATANHLLYVGADINVLEGLLLNAYFGAANLEQFKDSWYIGANLGYEVYDGITLAVNVQYATEAAKELIGGDISEGSVKAAGFSITPKVSVAF